MAGLNDKQRRFVEEYLVDLNATQAAIRAGYSEKTAQMQSSRLLLNVMVAQAISEAQLRRSKRTEITQDRVLQELAKLGFGDIRDIFSENGSLRHPKDMDPDAAARISSIEVVVKPVPGTQGQEVEHVAKIKAWDKLGALTQIGRHLGMFKDKLETTGEIVINITPDDANL